MWSSRRKGVSDESGESGGCGAGYIGSKLTTHKRPKVVFIIFASVTKNKPFDVYNELAI